MIVQHKIRRFTRESISTTTPEGTSFRHCLPSGIGCSCASSTCARSKPRLQIRQRCACACCPHAPSLSRVAQAQRPRAKMAARCSARWLLVAAGAPRLPAAAGRGVRPPRGVVGGTSLSRKLSITAFTPSLGARGPGALLTLRPGVSLTGEGKL